MSTTLPKSIKNSINCIVYPLIKNYVELLKTSMDKLKNSRLTLTNHVTGSGLLSVTDSSNNVVVYNTIADDSHTHTEVSINASVQPKSNTIVKRDNGGNIFSNGNSITNTGYKLANGNDISTLFKLPTSNPWTVATTKSGTATGVVSGVSVSRTGNAHVILALTLRNTFCWGNVSTDCHC